jgi:hypothetical protein
VIDVALAGDIVGRNTIVRQADDRLMLYGPPRPSLAAGSHKGESGEVPNPIFQSSIDFGA